MPNIGEFLISRLKSNGIGHAFTVPGDFSLKFVDKIYKSKEIELVTTTTEASAGFAADAYARVNGMGCVVVTYCVGGFNVCNAVGGAFAEKSPVVVISGAPGIKERDSKVLLHHMVGSYESQARVFSNITCAQTVLNDPERAGYEIDRVLMAAKQYSQPVYIELPRDCIDKSIRYDPYAQGTPKEFVSNQESLEEALAEACTWINGAKNPVMLAGVEVARFGLGDRLMKFCEQTNIPIATTILGKSVVSERHPLCLGVYSATTSCKEVREVVEGSDCIIMLGVMMTDMNLGFLPIKTQKKNSILSSCRATQIHSHTYEDVWFVDFVGNLLKSKLDKHCEPILPRKVASQRVLQSDTKLTSQRLYEKINSILTKDMILIADVGDSLFGCLDVTIHDSCQFLSQAFYTSMGFAVPAALGAQTARPAVRPIVIVGDGAFQMTGMEFSTLVRRGLNAIVVVVNNGGYSTERMLLDGPYNNIQNWSYDAIPGMVGGGNGFRVETEIELEKAFSVALHSKTPSIINCIIDPKDLSPALQRMFSNAKSKI